MENSIRTTVRYLSIRALVEYLGNGVSEAAVRRWLLLGVLPGVSRAGRRILVDKQVIDERLASGQLLLRPDEAWRQRRRRVTQ